MVLFLESKNSLEKIMPLYSKQKEKSNGACFSCIASSCGEVKAFEVAFNHLPDVYI